MPGQFMTELLVIHNFMVIFRRIPNKRGFTMKSYILKASLILSSLLLVTNVCFAHVSIGIGVVPAPQAVYVSPPPYYAPPPPAPAYYYEAAPEPVYAPVPYYAAPAPVRAVDMVWVPSHLESGYWVPGRYVEYDVVSPGPGYFWVHGGWDRFHHHWHHGYWHR